MNLNFLAENKILLNVKTRLLPIIEQHRKVLHENIEGYLVEKAPEYKAIVVSFIMSKVKLPWYLKPFKGKVQKAIEKNFDKLVIFIQSKISLI